MTLKWKPKTCKKPETPLISALVTDFCAKDCCPKWERLLLKKFTVAVMEGNPTSLKLKVEIETMDTAERSSVTVLVDSGATREFIDRHYAKSSCFNLIKLTQPIPVYNINGTLNEAGSITEVVMLIHRFYLLISNLHANFNFPGQFVNKIHLFTY
jgi:hypothetical protein